MASTKLVAAFDEAVKSSKQVEAVDTAIIETGRSIARAIDEIVGDPKASATDKTKALYLAPHLVAILRELLATPAARKQFNIATEQGKSATRLQMLKSQSEKP